LERRDVTKKWRDGAIEIGLQEVMEIIELDGGITSNPCPVAIMGCVCPIG
jgi:hypothetical protein